MIGDSGTASGASRSAADPKLHRQRLAWLGTLVGGFAHEIKNPLSTIGLNLQLMEEELGEPRDGRDKRLLQRTQRLRKEVDRLQGILDGFLAYVRVPEPKLELIALNSLVREIGDLVAPALEKQGITLQLLLREGLPKATVDRRAAHQVLLNLVRNAEQAIAEAGRRGEILVSTGFEPEGDAGWHVLTVTDSGPGMPPEILERCFHPYFSTKKGGTGLGLAITRRLVEDQGGDIEVESTPGTGTRFRVRLPLVPVTTGRGASPRKQVGT